VRQWVARQGSLDKLAYRLTAVEVAGSLLLIVFHVALDGLATSAPRWGRPNALITLREPAIARRAYAGTRLVDRIGLVLDDPNGFESAWRSFVPETP
jgi:hypothetical protein